MKVQKIGKGDDIVRLCFRKFLCVYLTFFLLLSGCAVSSAPNPLPESEPPEEIVNFSDDYAAGRLYRIIGKDFDMDAMGSYPQHIDGEPKPIGFQGNSLDIRLVVKNQKYNDLSPVPIENQVYPLTVQPYLEETEATAYSGELVSKLAAEIKGDDVMTYVINTTEAVSKALTYDVELAQEMYYDNLMEDAEDALAAQSGCCGEFTNLLLATLRYKGIPARFVMGIIYDETIKSTHFRGHYWAEFYLQGYGWIPVEPQAKVGVPNTYIKLYVGKDHLDIGVPSLIMHMKISSIEQQGMYTKRTTHET